VNGASPHAAMRQRCRHGQRGSMQEVLCQRQGCQMRNHESTAHSAFSTRVTPTSPERKSHSAARPSWNTPATRSPAGDQAQHMPASRPARHAACATHPAGAAR
jgi:hypothetical protein